ncbi:DUF5979 domain-containing protein [Streptomyces indicus]|uniref:DUF5979 domain-containing protein n=1 Tax=Streptomyces indicus TaxID=417292 RepID=A0A1G9GNM3_9ACTN|nr:DUF5979 domain-containing protein [Streptomyces indicus]SDL02248.1 hypothetical protein SAMN05421806_116110 [Streptomyces indicus]
MSFASRTHRPAGLRRFVEVTALPVVALAVVVGGAPVVVADGPLGSTPNDSRAQFVDENIRNCSDAGYPDDIQIYGNEAEDAGDAYVQGTGTGSSPTMVNVAITDAGKRAGVVIDAVVIKGGTGSNIYKAPHIPPDLEPPQNYKSPTNNGGNTADVSHYLICYHLEDLPTVTAGALLVLKKVTAPEGGTKETMPTSYTADVECTTPLGTSVEDTLTFGSGGGIARTSSGGVVVRNVPAGSTCMVTENGTRTFPEGAKVTYQPADASSGFVTGVSSVVVISNDFSGSEEATGSFTVTKAVVPPPYGPVPSTFTVNYLCQDGTKGSLKLKADQSATVDGIRADSYCVVREPLRTLPKGWTVSYSVNGKQTRHAQLFRVGDDAKVEIMVTNTGTGAGPTPPPDKDKQPA